MASTYTQLYVHSIFSPKYRERLLSKEWREEVFKYSNEIICDLKCKLVSMNGVEDHVHLLIGLHPTVSVSDAIGKVKSNTSRFINQKYYSDNSFEWQSGYSAFSISNSHLSRVALYIEQQEEHHKKKSFRSEYFELIKEHDVLFDDRYLFEFFD